MISSLAAFDIPEGINKTTPLKKNNDNATGVLSEREADTNDGGLATDIVKFKKAEERKLEIVWFNVLAFVYIYGAAFYGTFLLFSTVLKWQTYIFVITMLLGSAFGITVGAHRLWSHRSYKARWPAKLILVFFNCMAFQNSIYEWARDHRVHHKYSETDADPHNAMRGFFFSHVGWLMCKKHPEVKAKGKTIDMSDLEADPIVMFQHKYYAILMPLVCFVFTTVVPVYCWGESWTVAWHVCTIFRWSFLLNGAWSINSVCHLFGNKPYDRNFNPGENGGAVAFITVGESWHNYHHVFPWDYKAAELGGSSKNLGAGVIELFAKLGWAYDLKTVSQDIIRKRALRTGDGSHPIWGWGDKDQDQSEKESAIIRNKSE